MYSKLKISGEIEVITGLHIGGSGAFSAIGAVDLPIVKDVRNGYPIIPGSSLKGKMRTLLARYKNERVVEHNDDDPEIKRLFGAGSGKDDKPLFSRLIFSDMILSNWDELKKEDLTSKTEIKFENTISRATAIANPRQIERAIRGSKFDMDIIYEINGQSEAEIREDFVNINLSMRLLQYDYLGGHGSRGYGRIKFNNLSLKSLLGGTEESKVQEYEDILKDNIE